MWCLRWVCLARSHIEGALLLRLRRAADTADMLDALSGFRLLRVLAPLSLGPTVMSGMYSGANRMGLARGLDQRRVCQPRSCGCCRRHNNSPESRAPSENASGSTAPVQFAVRTARVVGISYTKEA